MVNKVSTKGEGTHSVPRILERHLGAHVTEGIDDEASKSSHHGVGGGAGACAWGTDGWRKEKDFYRDYQPIYSQNLLDCP